MTKPIIVVKICYKLLYVIQVVKKIFDTVSNSTDIKVFGRTYVFAILLLIGLALFLHPGCFCLAMKLLESFKYHSISKYKYIFLQV